jgi:Mg/Co/Ni transporter MgtE
MSPDFLILGEAVEVGSALEAVRDSDVAPEALVTIYVADQAGQLVGTVLVVRLLKAPANATLGVVAERDPVVVRADADIHEIVRKMSDFNLSTTPVVDASNVMLGVITVDDVLEMLLPTGWRRDFGMTAAEE